MANGKYTVLITFITEELAFCYENASTLFPSLSLLIEELVHFIAMTFFFNSINELLLSLHNYNNL